MKSIIWLLVALLPCLCNALDAPVVDIVATMADDDGHVHGDSVYVSLNWSPVPGAFRYRVFFSPQLPSTPTLLGRTRLASFESAMPTGWGWQGTPDVTGFFSVSAESEFYMVQIPAGSFIMGQAGVATPEHEVTLTNDYLLGETEVTNQKYLEAAQWAVDHGHATVIDNRLFAYGVVLLDMSSTYSEISFIDGQFGLRMAPGAGTWGFDNTDYDPSQHPIKMVSWYGAACYCDWLSQMNGLPTYYGGAWTQVPSPNNPYMAMGYRLPTEAEWEFAAQYDDERTYPWGEATPTCELVSFQPGDSGNCVGWTSPVGTHPTGASGLGLQDMAGNLWEWNNDRYSVYSSNPQTNPVGPASGTYRAPRGGNWIIVAAGLQCAFRGFTTETDADLNTGFRICRTVQ